MCAQGYGNLSPQAVMEASWTRGTSPAVPSSGPDSQLSAPWSSGPPPGQITFPSSLQVLEAQGWEAGRGHVGAEAPGGWRFRWRELCSRAAMGGSLRGRRKPKRLGIETSRLPAPAFLFNSPFPGRDENSWSPRVRQG